MPSKILVVDDEPDAEFLLTQKFRKQIKDNKMSFVFAKNGLDALDKLKNDPSIEIVLTDINMPEMDGLTLLAEIQKLDRLLKTIIVSAYGDIENIRSAMNKGAIDFITKPINFKDLEITLEKTIQEIQKYKEAADTKNKLQSIEKELDVARAIQTSIIPEDFSPFPDNNNFEIYGSMTPAKQVGGDFFDFFAINENLLGFCIADVSGKGVPAALFMTMTRSLIRAFGIKSSSPIDCLNQVNDFLCMENKTNMFVTVIYGILDVHSGEIAFANAGHNPPLLLSAEGQTQEIKTSPKVPLGIQEKPNYELTKLQLKKGETFFLYTDGITEAMNIKNEWYGIQKLQDFLKSNAQGSLETISKALIQNVHEFREGAEQSDDLTLLLIRWN